MPHFASDGIDIAFIEEGAGDPVLLIHGFGSTKEINWVGPSWMRTLVDAGYRAIAFDHRGHGASGKVYDPALYDTRLMAEDAKRLLDHLGISRADVIGYSMGARVGAQMALHFPQEVRSLVMGGLGYHLVEGVGLPQSIADAMEAPSLDDVTDPMGRMFRSFADANKQDLKALAACIRGSRQVLEPAEVARIYQPVLVAVGTRDKVAGDAHKLAALMPDAVALDIPNRDHNPAVGDKVFKQGVLDFLARRP
ncbi:alpha/beta fold hydrolase [Xanthobacter tagetidis]|uniref:Alpha/beta hydrolase n=1 Tax=Xanthobacter tagetidis TaxID=60216 RepID=A0A3L7AME4_9HYPH|nr:alpha/beta hydrolase [Xanthobacter tagetidis]MBB6307676.1 pimeloyl-ACP methyl ester carboxylesterase [Xanthobacter tagetidis]RLP81234.1 alpha/beta hydrolase [Xanthobacter tagetidis]